MGDSNNITWTSSGTVPDDLVLEYSILGSNFTGATSIATGESDDGTYAWTIPDQDQNDVRVRVRSASAPAINDMSDADFTVADIAVTSPNGSEQFQVGNSHNITWNADANVPDDLILEYTKDDTNYTSIATGVTASDETYAWTVPDDASDSVKVRIRSSSASDLTDSSDANFKMSKLNITAPNGGESWIVDTSNDITWEYDSLISDVKLE